MGLQGSFLVLDPQTMTMMVNIGRFLVQVGHISQAIIFLSFSLNYTASSVARSLDMPLPVPAG